MATHVFLVAGQSNAIGRDTFDGGATYPDGTLQWGRAGADDGVLVAASNVLQHVSPDFGDMGFTIQFAINYKAANPNVRIIFVPCAQGGTSFAGAHWSEGEANYVDAVARANACMTAADSTYGSEGPVVFKAILWHQGESDIGNVTYQAELEAMITAMRGAISEASASTPFILGELQYDVTSVSATNVIINAVPARVPYTAVSSASGLTKFDTLHFDAASLRTMGSRYVTAIASAIANGPAVPDQVTGLVVTPGNAENGLAWDLPDHNHSALTDYVIQVDSGSGFTTISDGTSTTRSYTHTGLNNGTAYAYRVAAVNSVGQGSYSSTASGTPNGYTFVNAEAESLVAAFSSEPSNTWKEAYDDFIGALKTASVWSALDALWIMRAPDSQSSKLEAKSAGVSYTLGEVNTPTFTASRGWAGDGSTSYLTTGFNPSTHGVQYTQNSASMGIYLDDGTDTSSSSVTPIGQTQAFILPRNSSALIAGRINQAASDTLGASGGTRFGLTVINRSGASAVESYKNGAAVSSSTTASAAISNAAIYLGCRNNGGTATGFSNNRMGLAFVGASLDSTAQAALDAAWDAFVTATT